MNTKGLLRAGWSLFIRSPKRMKTGASMNPPLRGAKGVFLSSMTFCDDADNTPPASLTGGMARAITRALLLFVLLITAACSTYNPKGPDDTSILIAPTKITVKLGPGVVELAWQFAGDTTKVKEYRVYRRNANEAAFKRIAAITMRRYRDLSPTIGLPAQYQIVAVNKSNFEGERSESAIVTPGVFSVQIGNNAKFTNRRLLTLTFNVPDNTAFMMLANDPAFAGATWEAFANNRTWELTPGDGPKSVYAKFRTADQAESEAVRTDIILDTIAFIRAITHDGAGRVLRPGDILHISLNAGEPLGSATVDLIDNANGSTTQDNNIRLFDNGSNGDVTRDDGVYELDYRIRPDMEFAGAFVYGSFTDAATNAAPMLVSGNSFSAQLPPRAVRLSNPVPDSTGLKLTWTVSNEKDFANYRIYRSTTSPVDTVATPLTILNDKSATTYRDAAVTPSTTYFYRVFVFDRFGLSAGSNQVQGRL